jgi:hypothetical protein
MVHSFDDSPPQSFQGRADNHVDVRFSPSGGRRKPFFANGKINNRPQSGAPLALPKAYTGQRSGFLHGETEKSVESVHGY